MKSRVFLLVFLSFIINSVVTRQLKYLGGLSENDHCILSNDPIVFGTCLKAKECKDEFRKFKNDKSDLTICRFNLNPENSIICCPSKSMTAVKAPPNSEYSIDFLTCRDRYLPYRKTWQHVRDMVDDLKVGKLNLTDETCETINRYGRPPVEFDLNAFSCLEHDENRFSVLKIEYSLFAEIKKLGDWRTLAGIGWTYDHNHVEFKCSGVIIADKFIISSAFCCMLNGKLPDRIRIGDRYLTTAQDDEHAQQLAIEKIISHPNYRFHEIYNDIALIKTKRRMIFNDFIAPACIPNVIEQDNFYTFAKFTQTFDLSKSIDEIKIRMMENGRCNNTFRNSKMVPKGILGSQLCIHDGKASRVPFLDICSADSGLPLQYDMRYDVQNEDTHVTSVYYVPLLVGITSFDIDCGFNIPSIITKVPYYKDWIQSVINEEMETTSSLIFQ